MRLTSKATDHAFERWSGNFRAIGVRPISEEERRDIRERVERLKIRRRILGGASGLGLLAFVAGFFVMIFVQGLGASLLVTGVLVFQYAVLRFRDANRAVGFFESELSIGEIEQFEIPEPDRVLPNFDLSEAGKAPGIWRFEAFRPTGRLVPVPDDPKADLILPIQSVAKRPQSLSPQFPERVRINPSFPGVSLTVRALSRAEMAELAQVRDSFSFRHSQFAVLAFCFCLLGVLIGAFDANEAQNVRLGCVLGYGAICLAILVFGRRRILGLFLLKSDLKESLVYVLPRDHPFYRANTGVGTVEILPHSGALWTIDGVPAGWRKRSVL